MVPLQTHGNDTSTKTQYMKIKGEHKNHIQRLLDDDPALRDTTKLEQR